MMLILRKSPRPCPVMMGNNDKVLYPIVGFWHIASRGSLGMTGLA
jgi:hypothetical protein